MFIKDYHAKLDTGNWSDRVILSTPVYISNYKMRLIVFLNGDETENSYMSVYFDIMVGEWDPIIKWPFDKDVKICLINQEKGKDSICNTLTAYNYLVAKKSAFDRLEKDDIGYGYQQFASHQIIDEGGFAKDGTVFLRCEIEM